MYENSANGTNGYNNGSYCRNNNSSNNNIYGFNQQEDEWHEVHKSIY